MARSLGVQPKNVDWPKVKNRTMHIREGDIVVYRRPRGMSETKFSDFINQAANDILARFGISTVVVGLDNWADMRILDEAEMEKMGYIRKERIFLLKEDVDMGSYTEEELKQIMSEYVISEDEE